MTKYIVTGLMAALMTTGMMSSAAFASPKVRFAALDVNQDQVLTHEELTSHGCKVKHSIFNYADENSDGKLTHHEYNSNYTLFPRCK